MAKIKFKKKVKEIDAEQLLVDTVVDFGEGPEPHKAGEWIVFKDDGTPMTTIHDVVFQKEWEVK